MNIWKKIIPEKFNVVTDFLKCNPIIDSLCYIPLNMANFVALAKNDEPLPTTQTELTSTSIDLIIARHLEGETNPPEKYTCCE